MTSSSEINQILKLNSHFLGCYSPAQLPSSLPSSFPKSLIVNTISSHQKIGHWTVVFMRNEKECFYFNPLGGKLLCANLIKFLSPLYSFVYYSDIAIQSLSSKNCALFCIYFIENVSSKRDYIRLIKRFSHENLKQNDNFMYNYVYGKI